MMLRQVSKTLFRTGPISRFALTASFPNPKIHPIGVGGAGPGRIIVR